MTEITVREVPIEEALKVEKQIPEYDQYTKKSYEERFRGKEKLILVGYVDNKPAGYVIGYDKHGDGSFYCWMAGVIPAFREMGALKTMMDYQEEWARKKGYKKIKIKTRNYRREMLSYLVKYGFMFTGVETKEDTRENRILLEKEIKCTRKTR